MKTAAWALALSALVATPVIAADPATIDWSAVPVTNVTLFYPGQSSYEWLRAAAHPGSSMVQSGEACVTCHQGKEKAMGDKLVKQTTIVTRAEPCVLSIHDKKHTELGGSWEASDIKATMDLRRVSPAIGLEPFTGSGVHGAVLTVSAGKGSGAIRQDMELSSSAIGLSHKTVETERFEFTISDDAVAERIRRALVHAVDLCRG